MKLGSEELTRRFLDEIKLRAFDDKYLDRREEREILQYAISSGIDLEVARGAFLEACRQRGFLVESILLEDVKRRLNAVSDGGNSSASVQPLLTEDRAQSAIAWLSEQLHGIRGLHDCQRLVIEQIECGPYRLQTGWFSNWYALLKKKAGWR
jgi:hypothetical protein